MTEMFGNRWTASFGEDAMRGAGPIWAKGLRELSEEQIAIGLTNLLASADDWPPSLPAFRKLCLNIPSLGAVQYELRTDGTRSQASAFSTLVWDLLDHYRYRNVSIVIADRLLRDAYRLAVELVMTEQVKL